MKFKRIIAILLVTVMSLGIVGCKDKKGDDDKDNGVFPESMYDVEGLHIDNSKETDGSIVKNGSTDYKVLVPQNISSDESFALYELTDIFKRATGITLQTVIDNGDADFSNKYISLGETSYKEESGLEMEKELKSRGYRIITKENVIIIAGLKGKGTINGVYHLMEKLFNYDYLYKDTIVCDENVKEVPMYDFDITEAPDIEYADINYKWIVGEGAQVVNRYRLMDSTDGIYVGDLAYHNEFSIFGIDKKDLTTLEGREKWVNDPTKPMRICYTAHGDEEEQQEMVDTAFERFKEQLIIDTEHDIACINIEDNGSYCKCDACAENENKYGASSAAFVQFANKLKLRIDEWFESEEGEPYARDLEISIGAYLDFATAPVKVDDDGEFYVVDESVKCVDGVVPKVIFLHADYTVPLNHEKNEIRYDSILGWATLSEELTFYIYNTNYHHMLAPYDTFDSLQENFRMALHYKTRYLQNLCQHVQANYSTGYNTLSAYLQSKLAWNVNIDMQAYIEKFFTYYFEDAADVMYDQFMSWRGWSDHLENDFGTDGYDIVFDNVIREDWWPKNVLEQWFTYYDRALEEIEYIKDIDKAKYDKLYDHITGEKVSTLYLYIEIYGDKIPADTCLALKKECKGIAEHMGMSAWKEGGIISEVWTRWQV